MTATVLGSLAGSSMALVPAGIAGARANALAILGGGGGGLASVAAGLPTLAGSGAGLLAIVAAGALLAPALGRSGVLFSVAVQPWLRGTPEGRRILWHYRLRVGLHFLIALGLLAGAGRLAGTGGTDGTAVAGFVPLLAAVAWQLAGSAFAFRAARLEVLPHGIEAGAAEAAAIARQRVGMPGGWTLQAAPFVALAATALDLQARWGDLPERFPVHWGLDGQPNGWAVRNPAGVFGPLVLGAVIAGSVVLFAALLRREPRLAGATAGATDAGAASAVVSARNRFRHAVLWTLLATECIPVGLTIWISRLPLAARAPGQAPGAPAVGPLLALVGLFVAAATIVLARLGRDARQAAAREGAARRHLAGSAHPAGSVNPADQADSANPANAGRDADSCWKAGLFYVNPDDPALFVEKRIGIGYTLNFARPMSWLILGLSILGPIAVALWIVHSAAGPR